MAVASALQQERGMKLLELFSKEKREERKRKLREEMDQGYFDDFRDFRDKQGKVFMAPEKLVPASHAPHFPQLEALLPDGTAVPFPPVAAAAASCSSSGDSSSSGGGQSSGSGGSSNRDAHSSGEGSGRVAGGPASTSGLPSPRAGLVCVAFRAGAQPMIEQWASAFGHAFAGRCGAALYELSLVEGVVMRLPPFRQMLLREAGRGGGGHAGMPTTYLFRFGGTGELRSVLQMTNRLTGYVFLLDSRGRLRWRGSGAPDARELQSLLRCTEELLAAQ
eukprot:scaffold3.g6613.t1